MTRLLGISDIATDRIREGAETAEKGVEALGEGVDKVETATEFLEGIADRLEETDMGSLASAVEASLPWLEYAGEVAGEALPPIKAVLKVVGLLTKEPDPRALGLLAFSLAYETAVASAAKAIEHDPQAAAAIRRTVKPKGLRRLLAGKPENVETFESFRLIDCFAHPLMECADRMLVHLADAAGWPDSLQRRLREGVHARFRSTFRQIISDGQTKEKFDPLFRFMQSDRGNSAGFPAIQRHIEYQLWSFNEATVLGRSRIDVQVNQTSAQLMRLPFSLREIYVPLDCGTLKWAEICRMDSGSSTPRTQRSAFDEDAGGRHSLLEQVLHLMGDPDFRDAIVIQGFAGAGKSAFTLQLCVELRKLGLRPVRIRMRHLALDSRISLFDDMAQAIAQNSGDDFFDELIGSPRPIARDFDLNHLFDESTTFRNAQISPHVLIFDGWDEISASASGGFKEQISNTLSAIRREILVGARSRVRVILTGRPSIDVAKAQVFSEETPILTIRPFTDTQLKSFSGTLLDQHRRSMSGAPALREARLAALMRLDGAGAPSDGGEERILRLPLLALLAIWLTLSDEASPETLGTDRTALYRRLIDITCRHGGSLEEIPPSAPRIVGEKLRELLRRTAAAMTIHDTENISYFELKHRLRDGTPSGEDIREATRETVASMVMSFFFHSGTSEHGCEFIHKSFREYLFAEAVVETLKGFGEQEEARRTPYWLNFGQADSRRHAIERLTPFLAAQWITPEVARHLLGLLEWEIKRAAFPSDGGGNLSGETRPSALKRWQAIRDVLADFWDWWAEGVHLRPQPYRRDDTGVLDYREPYAVLLARALAPAYRPEDDKFPEPVRTATLDAHLGDALFRLNCTIHFQINLATGWLDRAKGSKEPIPQALWKDAGKAPRAYQTQITDGEKAWLAFAPATDHQTSYLEAFASRINAAGWRPQGVFPSGIDMRGVDLAGATLPLRAASVLPLRAGSDQQLLKLCYARLENADLNQANISDGDLSFTAACGLKCMLSHAQGASFRGAYLRNADFSFSTMMKADFADAMVEGAEFQHTDIRGIDGAKLVGAKLETAR
jgi:hypothetical protein